MTEDTFKLLTDHKPLGPLINTQDLNKALLRCQHMLMRQRGYNLHAEHVPEKHLNVPDTRNVGVLLEDQINLKLLLTKLGAIVDLLENSRSLTDRQLEQIQRATEGDGTLQKAINHIRHGWPIHMNSILRIELRDYFVMRSELSESRGQLLYRNRMGVLETLKSEILRIIHHGHLGLAKCRARTKDSVWWPVILNNENRLSIHHQRVDHGRELLQTFVNWMGNTS